MDGGEVQGQRDDDGGQAAGSDANPRAVAEEKAEQKTGPWWWARQREVKKLERERKSVAQGTRRQRRHYSLPVNKEEKRSRKVDLLAQVAGVVPPWENRSPGVVAMKKQ